MGSALEKSLGAGWCGFASFPCLGDNWADRGAYDEAWVWVWVLVWVNRPWSPACLALDEGGL
jgi:hypothetical protein